MKTQEFHLLNRTYITQPDTNTSAMFGIPEDIITPDKIKYILDNIDKCQKNNKNEYILKMTFNESLYNFEKKQAYMMTLNPFLFNSIPSDNPNEIFEWLINHWNDRFLITFSIYHNYIFDIEKVCFIKKTDKEIEFNNLIKNNQYTIGNGLILALSIYSLGNYWSSENFKEAFEQFLMVNYNKLNTFIQPEWKHYYKHYLQISEYPFFYAFQYVPFDIYSLIFNYTKYKYNYYNYYNNYDNRMYFGTLYSAVINPTIEHYKFMKNTHYTKFINLMNNYQNNLKIHYNIYDRLLHILKSRQLLKDFLSKGVTWNTFIYFIYLYKRLNILKIIQSLSYLYKNSNIPKRSIKFVWRMLMKEFSKDFINVMCGYLLECTIYQNKNKDQIENNNNEMSQINIPLPPTKMIRDSIYIIQNDLSYYKKYILVIMIKKNKPCIIPNSLALYKKVSKKNKNKYIFKINYFNILKILNYQIFSSIYQRKLNILISMKKINYELYRCMLHYYKNNLDDLWKKNNKKLI